MRSTSQCMAGFSLSQHKKVQAEVVCSNCDWTFVHRQPHATSHLPHWRARVLCSGSKSSPIFSCGLQLVVFVHGNSRSHPSITCCTSPGCSHRLLQFYDHGLHHKSPGTLLVQSAHPAAERLQENRGHSKTPATQPCTSLPVC